MFEKDSFIVALIAGFCVPVIGYAIIMIVFEQLNNFDATSVIALRPNTHALLAISFNIILIQIAKRRSWNESIRGIVFATLILSGVWFWKYSFVFNM